MQVAHGTVFRPAELPGLIAQAPGEPMAGLLTYEVRGPVLEIVTLNAVPRRAGIGTALVEEAIAEAVRRGCREVRLTTTNDNVNALRFYQRRGFRLVELRPGAVARARDAEPGNPRDRGARHPAAGRAGPDPFRPLMCQDVRVRSPGTGVRTPVLAGRLPPVVFRLCAVVSAG